MSSFIASTITASTVLGRYDFECIKRMESRSSFPLIDIIQCCLCEYTAELLFCYHSFHQEEDSMLESFPSSYKKVVPSLIVLLELFNDSLKSFFCS